MIHVALCTDGVFPHAMGGMQRHSRLLAEHLALSGKVRLTVLHPHALRVFDEALGIQEVRIGPIRTDRLYLRELWRYSGRVAEALDGIAPDVILSQGFCVWKDIGRFSSKLLVHPHGLEMFQGITFRERAMGLPFRLVLRHILRHARGCVSLGGGLTRILEKQVIGSGCVVHVLPNAVEMPTDAPVPTWDGNRPLELLFVGRFAFNKGIDVLMEVARRLDAGAQSGRVHFSLCGDGPLLEHYRRSSPPANVRLLGRVDDDALDMLYRSSDILVLPTRFEGMPTVVLEAMARGKPVLVSDVGATAELVDAANGRLLPPGDAEALYTAVVELIALPPQAITAMGLASRRRVDERFTWPRVTGEFIRLFERMSSVNG